MGRRYRPGATVVVSGSTSRPRIGEVWAFVGVDDRVVVHRCVWSRPSSALRFKGDAERRLDEPVEPNMLVGRVSEVVDDRRRWVPRRWHALPANAAAYALAAIRRARSWDLTRWGELPR